ncbi:hypothetical protein [Umezawaea sp. Da 62-37]|uniref:hypothetical protein n=1 Tax=Umezawaea sp. Da 62-37 TaxID=3075927 RepID=UPI0028F74A02|nr:hypothetical protein [Umezawaea sp. Da 62-37]WNV85715.1 hypothetical protein RM788_47640 [Umezawaea sp. Da 62-37]
MRGGHAAGDGRFVGDPLAAALLAGRGEVNPEAVDFANRVVQCLREKGVRYVEVVNDPGESTVSYAFGGPNNDSESITLGLDHAEECEIASSTK